ncbi:nucleotidyltransferase family protein [Ferrimonas aestuarii]|uniref:NDP-sugar synthase n=1 Tax=Ferrimonas aestuarii TaxID=2569539 RepID=A0A4U1BKY7_9GAMM|nr:NDP-sugar synthase [Ferrimonas aestuarii]TKB53012.1 NDP-sugar synthase [Ferrimonas aestuarii]
MRGMILGAGSGTRVRPITEKIPKPMIPILRRPLMESIIGHFKRHGIDEIIVNTCYMAPVLEDYFRDGKQYGVDLCYSYEGKKLEDGSLEGKALGSAGGMRRVQQTSGFFHDTFVVVCGDAWIDLDFTEAIAWHKKKGGLATIVTKKMPKHELHKYGVVNTLPDGRVVGFQEKPKTEDAKSDIINTGIYIFEPEIFNYIPANGEYDIGGDLFPDLVRRNLPFYAKAFDFQWVDVGRLSDVWQVTKEILTGEIQNYPIPGKEIAPGVYVGINCVMDLEMLDIKGPVVIGNGCRIHTGAKLRGPLVIGNNCVIESGAVLENASVDDYSRVCSKAYVTDRMIIDDHCIDHEGNHCTVYECGMNHTVKDSRVLPMAVGDVVRLRSVE